MRTRIVKTESACAEEDSLWAWTIRVNQKKVRQARISELAMRGVWQKFQKLEVAIVEYYQTTNAQKRMR